LDFDLDAALAAGDLKDALSRSIVFLLSVSARFSSLSSAILVNQTAVHEIPFFSQLVQGCEGVASVIGKS
jgi:hypothetical protein